VIKAKETRDEAFFLIYFVLNFMDTHTHKTHTEVK